MLRTWLGVVVVLAVLPMAAWAGSAGAGESARPGPVKVFILAGQSNMEGYGHVRTLPHLAALPGGKELLAKLTNPDGSWKVRDDVFVYFHSGQTVGNLTVGFGGGPEYVGPELAFGTLMGDRYEEPVLLIKTAWGGKDLHFDFRPPSAGELPYPIDAEALAKRGGTPAVGDCYRKMTADVKDCLSKMGTYFPALKGRTYEIVGLVWFQGWNEMFPAKGCEFERVVADYPALYADLVKGLEGEFKLRRLPSVVGEMGVDGELAKGRTVELRRRQAEIGQAPALAGKVRFVRTADLWDPRLDEMQAREQKIRKAAKESLRARVEAEMTPKLEGKTEKERRQMLDRAMDEAIEKTDEYRAWQKEWETIAGHWECHYWGSAPVYCRIGARLGEAMGELLREPHTSSQ
jgi:hypothetical protein